VLIESEAKAADSVGEATGRRMMSRLAVVPSKVVTFFRERSLTKVLSQLYES
jgi:hypothetical protein